ncbi:MAG: STT3 domain-containing protein [Candidatus Bathyarchaeia archaeon]
MPLPSFSKESVINGLKKLGMLRIKTSHSTLLTYSALTIILLIAFTVRLFPIRWEIETGSVHLSEFDPYYQYSLTRYMVQNGLLSPYYPPPGWVDHQRWYYPGDPPGGINMSLSLWSLPLTTAILYNIVTTLGVNIDLMEFCAFIPAILGTLAVLIIYFLGKDFGGRAVGLFAALSLALSPSLIQRTSLGFFDTETVGIVSLLLFSFLFLRAIEENRPIGSTVKYSVGSGLALAYFITGWGAAYYLIGLSALFVFVLLLLRRYNQRLFVAYSLSFGLGLMLSIQNPFISLGYLTSFAVLPVAGVFVLLCINEVVRNLSSTKSKVLFVVVFLALLVAGFAALWVMGYMHGIAGKFISVINPFVRTSNPLVESVAEHRISAWGSIYYDLGVGIFFSLGGLFFVARKLANRNLFLLLFGVTSLYFASSMVRLLALMAPAFALLMAIGIVGTLRPFVTIIREQPRIVTKRKFSIESVGKEFSGVAIFLIFLILMTNFAVAPQSGGMPKVYRQAYAPVTITAGSLPIAPNQPVREWLDMLKYLNDFGDSTIVVCSWWDYGYWLSLLGNVTSLADNATINNTQIENIGFIMMTNETNALKMLRLYNAKYILVFTTVNPSDGSWVGYGDEGKWMWMARISAQGSWPDRIAQGLVDERTTWVNETSFGSYNTTTGRWQWNDFGKNSVIYKLLSYGKSQWTSTHGTQDPEFPVTAPTYFKEAYFAGKNLTPSEASSRYGMVPLICLYEIDWQKYYADYPSG